MKKTAAFLLSLLMLLSVSTANAATFLSHGSREEKKVAITLDDWWNPKLMLEEYLDLAKDYGIVYTLYPCGGILKEEDRDLWQRAVNEGHEIGNHTTSHIQLSTAGYETISKQMNNMQKHLDATLGYHYEILTCRIPGGDSKAQGENGTTGKALTKLGYENVIFWDIEDTDAEGILKHVQNGSIILLHGNNYDIKQLRIVIPELLARGYECVTVSELLHITSRSEKGYIAD